MPAVSAAMFPGVTVMDGTSETPVSPEHPNDIPVHAEWPGLEEGGLAVGEKEADGELYAGSGQHSDHAWNEMPAF